MKLRFIPVLLVLLLMSADVFAQEVLYTEYEKFDFRSGEFSVVGKVGDKLYVYRGSSEGYYLDAYDDNMHRLATVILDFLPRRCYGTKFITYKDRMVVLYQATGSGNVVLYATVLDINGRILKRPKQIDEAESRFLRGRSGLYNYAISKDKQQIVAYGVNTDDNILTTRVLWLDSAINKQSKSQATFEADNDIAVGEGIVNNDGKFFLAAYTPYGARDYADRIWMLSMNIGAAAFNSAEVPMGELYASGTYMELAHGSDRIYVGGFFSDRKNGSFIGIIYTYYDIATNSFKDFKTIDFSERLRTLTGQRNKKRAFNDYRVRKLIVKNDGGFVLLAEDFYVTTRNNYNGGFGYYSWYYPTMYSSVREYFYGDVIALSCDGNGKPEWAKFIRKNQYSQEDGGLFSSFALVNTGGSLGVLYNDFNVNNSRIQVVSLDADGNLNNKTLKNAQRLNPDWLPKSGKQVSYNEFVAPCLKRNQICFAKVVF